MLPYRWPAMNQLASSEHESYPSTLQQVLWSRGPINRVAVQHDYFLPLAPECYQPSEYPAHLTPCQQH